MPEHAIDSLRYVHFEKIVIPILHYIILSPSESGVGVVGCWLLLVIHRHRLPLPLPPPTRPSPSICYTHVNINHLLILVTAGLYLHSRRIPRTSATSYLSKSPFIAFVSLNKSKSLHIVISHHMGDQDPSATDATTNKIDNVFSPLDHLAARMTASATTGLGCGAIYSTYRGLPIAKTSLSAAVSCALVSTACFGAERIAYAIIHQITGKDSKSSPNLLYSSHALGGICGGGIVGFLYQGNPFRGIFLLTPMMLGIGKLEISLDQYKASRIEQLREME